MLKEHFLIKAASRIIVEGVLIGFIAGASLVPMSLLFSNALAYINEWTSDNYKRLLIIEKEIEVELINNNRNFNSKISLLIREIESLEKKGTHRAAYILATYYAFGIPGTLNESKILCNYYKITSAKRLNASALLLDC